MSAADPEDHTDLRPEVRRVLVAEPLRFVRDAIVAAVDAQPGLAAIDGSAPTDTSPAGPMRPSSPPACCASVGTGC